MQAKKINIGITGGIGSGKSFVCRYLETLHIPVFYTDLEARKEMLTNTHIHEALQSLLNTNILTADNNLNKAALSSFINQGPDHAQLVDDIVHPYVRQKLRLWIQQQSATITAVECALLFESHFDEEVSYSVLVTAPLEVRLKRVMERDHKTREEILKWISLQMPEEQKEKRANFVIQNDGKASIPEQVKRLLSNLPL